MDYKAFYKNLFVPIEERIGPIDELTIMSIIGFDCGGPVNLSTVGSGRDEHVTYVTCELAVRDEQKPSKLGRYEVMMSCDDESFARKILTTLGHMSLEKPFGHGHTVDMEQVIESSCALKGTVVEEFARTIIDGKSYGLLRFHGVTRDELAFARTNGVDALLKCLRKANVYPNTSVGRERSTC